jgi:hypothetical protein
VLAEGVRLDFCGGSDSAIQPAVTFDLAFSPEQELLESVFKDFFTKMSPPSVARNAEPLGFDAALWLNLAAVEAPSLAVDGASLSELVVVAEALGRAIAPVPLVEHLAATRSLGPVDGIATIAVRPAERGLWSLVPAGAVADVVVGVDGSDLVAVRSEPPGRGPRNFAAAPLADRAVSGERTVLGPASSTPVDDWKVLTAAALVGVATSALGLAVEYVKSRIQFDVPIGSFQAVQHGLADLPGLIDGARLLTHKAAWAVPPGVADSDWNEVTDPAALASMAFVFASEIAALATDRSLHYHGGYGFAEEYDIQLYYRRARGWPLVLGDPAHEARALADRLFP